MAMRFPVLLAALTLFGCAAPHAPRLATPLTCDGTRPCEVDIVNPTCTGTSCSAEVRLDPVTFRRGKHDIVIRWKLPEGFGFCTNMGDGVFLKGRDTDDQFKDAGASGPDRPGVCKRAQFVWTAKNTVPDRRFPYKIVFHTADGTTLYVVDPTMFNE